ncbi:MAG: hypothetical protein KAT85_10620, partial [candidate division Zixibacteria bacterium]|nr:hypothetical protein [candidate division Zixibacteria bacterium]
MTPGGILLKHPPHNRSSLRINDNLVRFEIVQIADGCLSRPLSLLGVRSKSRRAELIDELYDYLRDFFEQVRRKEEAAIRNKNLARRRMKLKPADIAAQILEEIGESETWLLQQYDPDFVDTNKLFDTFDIPQEGTPQESPDMLEGRGLRFVKGKKQTTGRLKTQHKAQDDLIVLLVENGHRGLLRIPHERHEAKHVLISYSKFLDERDERLRSLIEERTSDEDFQEKI